ncbi:PEP-CTERM sorting domain-containing protein [Pseudoduganella plicata]|nr:PEP-CTERM sorting domain-containing protein [Pseudoduganella plicata]
MKKTLFALLLATAASANAAPITVTFDYTGAWHESYHDDENGDQADYEFHWQPSATLSARFTAEDINGNNIIEKNEVTSLIANGIEFRTPWTPAAQYTWGFRYRNTRDYDIYVQLESTYDYAHASYFYAGWTPSYQWWETSDYTYYDSWFSSTDTVATVVSSVPSVPEPTTFAMLGIGLSIIGLSRRRINAAAR